MVHPSELGPGELTRWRQLHGHPELANPFLAPEFAVGVGRVRPSGRVAVLEEGPEVVGFFPSEWGPFRVGRPIGAGLSDCQGLVHAPGSGMEPAGAAARRRAARLGVRSSAGHPAPVRALSPRGGRPESST